MAELSQVLMEEPATTPSQSVTHRRQPVAPYIPAERAHPSDTFLGYSEPVPPGSPYVSIRGLYSSTQFDTLSVLSRVYTRPNPKIELGPVDDSVSFVVVDATRDDSPVVYCSQNFHKLTGYSREEIVGRNCRFLQYPPDSKTSVTRSHNRSPAVEAFKRSLMQGQECQASLINYRRDGEAFLNLISVVPIRWKEEKTGEEKEYYVGFQVDLNDALGGGADEPPQVPLPPSRQPNNITGYNARGPGDETWAET